MPGLVSSPLLTSSILTLAMAALAVSVAAGFTVLVARAAGPRSGVITALVLGGLMAVQFGLASSGVLRQWDKRPPPFFFLVPGMVLIVISLARSALGTALAETNSFALLVGAQAFRLPLELTMHQAALEGVMPVQMSYSGYNFDILTGASALLLGILLACGRAGRRAVRVWNIAGFCLLVNIVSIAVASLPVFRAFGDDRVNVWIAYPPYVWLPGVLVPAALLGHLLVWRKLRSESLKPRS